MGAAEEITISYIDTDLDYQRRQTELADYGFMCGCARCQRERPRPCSPPNVPPWVVLQVNSAKIGEEEEEEEEEEETQEEEEEEVTAGG